MTGQSQSDSAASLSPAGLVELRELFPVFLKLRGRRCVVVGGGPVAHSKIGPLLDCGAVVQVVAPELTFTLEHPSAHWERKPFEASDLDGAWYVVAAATPEVNRAVVAAAETRRLFVNAVDDPEVATAYLGGVLRRSGMVFALCGNGAAPALTGLLKEALDALLPDELDGWLEHATRLKRAWRAEGVPMSARRPLLLEALNALYANKTKPSP